MKEYLTVLGFHSAYNVLEFTHYYEDRVGLFSSMDTEESECGTVLKIFTKTPLNKFDCIEMVRDFSVNTAVFNQEVCVNE